MIARFHRPLATLPSLLVLSALVLSLVLSAAACVRPTTPPPGDPPAAGTPDRPRIVSAEARLTETEGQGGYGVGTIPMAPGQETVIGADSCVFHLQLEPPPSAAWYARNITVVGANAQGPRSDLFELGMVEVRFPPGRAAERVSVSLASVSFEGSTGSTAVYSMRRAAEPRATLEIWQDNRWREIEPSEVVQARPLRLRIVFSKPMDQATVAAAIRAQLQAEPKALAWSDPRTVVFELDAPPPALRLNLLDMQDIEGLWCHGGLPAVFTGAPARLYSWRPGQDAGVPARLMPANLTSIQVNPAGDRFLVSYVAETTSQLHPRTDTVQIIGSGGAPLPPLSFAGTPVGWYDDASAVLAGEDGWAVLSADGTVRLSGELPEERLWLLTLSPDGRKLAGMHFRYGDTWRAPHYLSPADLAVIDLDAGELTWYQDITRLYLPPTEGFIQAAPAWAPDSGAIAMLGSTETGGEIAVADLATGQAQIAATLSGDLDWTQQHLSWLRDGKAWLVADLLVSTATGETTSLNALPGSGAPVWSATGRYVAYGRDWVSIRVVDADRWSGIDLGPGLSAGWTQGSGEGMLWYVVWPDASERYTPGH